MDDNITPPVDLSDAPDVSLIDTPMDQNLDTSGDTAEESHNEGADTESTSDEETADAKGTEAESTDSEEHTTDEAQTVEQDQPSKDDRDRIARQAYQERQRTRQQIAQQIDQEFAPKTAEDFVSEGKDQQEAQIEALRQEMQFSQERTRVAELNANMRAEALEVMNDFPVFNPKSPDFNEELAKEAESSYRQAARIQTNDAGSIILNADASLYEHYQRMARIFDRGTDRGKEAGRQQTLDQMARTETPGGSSSTNGPAPGSLEELERRLGDVVIT